MLVTDHCPLYLSNRNAPVSHELNAAVRALAYVDMPEGFDIREDAPNSYEELVAYHAQTGRICTPRYEHGGLTFGNHEDHAIFRAWHDLGHVLSGGVFTVPGEHQVLRWHRDRIFSAFGENEHTRYWIELIRSEIISQNEYFELTGAADVDARLLALTMLELRGVKRPVGLV